MAWRTRLIFHGALKLKVRNVSGEELRCVQTALNHVVLWKATLSDVRGGRHLSIRAHLLLASRSMWLLPYRPPHPSSFDLTSSVFSCLRCLAHNEIRRSAVVCYTQSCSSADIDNTDTDIDNTQDSLKSQKKRKTLLFFCLPSGQKHDSISFSISALRTKNIFRSVGVGGFNGTKCLFEHLVKKIILLKRWHWPKIIYIVTSKR